MKYSIEKVLDPKHLQGTSKKTGKPYDFWSIAVISNEKLIQITGNEDYIKGLKAGDVLDGTLEENPYTNKEGEQKLAYKFKPKSVYERIADLEKRVYSLENNENSEEEIDDPPF